MIQKYSPASDEKNATAQRYKIPTVDKQKALRVAITGTTGTFGSTLAATLAMDSHISEVICLNRSPNAERQWNQRPDAGTNNRAAITFFTVDLGKPNFNLPHEDIDKLQSVDIFIHNAWKVDFNQSLTSFADDLQGLVNVINLCRTSQSSPHMVYVSSISSSARAEEVPESEITDLSTCATMGYGQSKLVAEHVLKKWTLKPFNLHATVLRIGQIAGPSLPSDSPWPEKEAFPGLFHSSKSLALMPNDLSDVRWIPIDRAANAVVELAKASLANPSDITYYNVVNPRPTQWQALLEPLRNFCGATAKETSMRQWVNSLKALDPTNKKHLEENPALKTIEFFEGLAQSPLQSQVFVTTEAENKSRTLKELAAITTDMFEQWLTNL